MGVIELSFQNCPLFFFSKVVFVSTSSEHQYLSQHAQKPLTAVHQIWPPIRPARIFGYKATNATGSLNLIAAKRNNWYHLIYLPYITWPRTVGLYNNKSALAEWRDTSGPKKTAPCKELQMYLPRKPKPYCATWPMFAEERNLAIVQSFSKG